MNSPARKPGSRNATPSPTKSAGGRSPSKDKNKSKGFPTTPRSAEKTQNNLLGKLRSLMQQNVRLNQTNSTLKCENKELLDKAVKAETQNHQSKQLMTKAVHQVKVRN